MNKKTVYVVAHSHWDREWYFTIEDSNVLLSENLPYLMTSLENDSSFTSYTFDAQLSIVDEFLKLYPEESERLKNLITDKRLFVGPWYTQTDSLLVNKESMIRNLLYGTRLGQSFGHSMSVGYLPDIFGQNAYLPSIFKGFGIENSILQRGIYTNQLNNNLNFEWVSPDGESVNANNIFLGYGPGKFLASDDEYMNKKLIPMLEKLEALNVDSDYLLLPAGGDQVLIRNHFPQTIKELNEKQDKYHFVLSNYEAFMEDTFKNTFSNQIAGELIASEKSRIHNTIKSQRYDIKQLNTVVENKILYVLEPLNVIGKQFGIDHKTTTLDMMWKLLFDVHAHDSIGGCNSDETNAFIMSRLHKVNEMCDSLVNLVKKKLTYAISKTINQENILVLFNTLAKQTKSLHKAVVFTNTEHFTLETVNGEAVQFNVTEKELISGGKQVQVTANGEVEVELPGYYRHVVLLEDVNVKSMGFTTLVVVENEAIQNDVLAVIDCTTISNEMYELTFNNNNLKLTNKVTKESIDHLITFENCGDHGDSYDFSPLANDTEILFDKATLLEVKSSRLSQTMKVKHEVFLPANLEERVNKQASQHFEIITCIELRAKESIVRVNHTLTNEIKDHRVRIVVNSNIHATSSISDQGFSAISRQNKTPFIENWRELKFAEAPVAIYALENFAAIHDDKNCLGVITEGIKEYEVLEDSKIALSLYRSVGLLGRDDLAWRPGRASGINNKVVYTPDAQMMMTMTFNYGIYFGSAKKCDELLFNLTDEFLMKHASYQLQKLNLFEERLERFEIPLNASVDVSEYSLFSIENENVFMSVCKQAYELDGFIVRLFNPTAQEEVITFNSEHEFEVVETNLYEQELSAHACEYVIKPKGYITLKIKG